MRSKTWVDKTGVTWKVNVEPPDWFSPNPARRRSIVSFWTGPDRYMTSCRPVQHAFELGDSELEALLIEAFRAAGS